MSIALAEKVNFFSINDLISYGRRNRDDFGNIDDCAGMAEKDYELVKLIGRSRSRIPIYGNIDDVLHLGLPQGALCIISLGRGSLECFTNIDRYIKEGMTAAYAFSLQHHLNSRMEYDFSTVFYRYENDEIADTLAFGTTISGRSTSASLITALEELVKSGDNSLTLYYAKNEVSTACVNTLVIESKKC